jgi:hypothetical protein
MACRGTTLLFTTTTTWTFLTFLCTQNCAFDPIYFFMLYNFTVLLFSVLGCNWSSLAVIKHMNKCGEFSLLLLSLLLLRHIFTISNVWSRNVLAAFNESRLTGKNTRWTTLCSVFIREFAVSNLSLKFIVMNELIFMVLSHFLKVNAVVAGSQRLPPLSSKPFLHKHCTAL